jgi:hypothetical protein
MKTGAATAGWLPVTGAFIVWFAHFMACWVAVEIWPRQWIANALAWGATAVALLALGACWVCLGPGRPAGETASWTRRLGRGATAIASVAVVFSALPSLVFLP